jgi:hypothetical protein
MAEGEGGISVVADVGVLADGTPAPPHAERRTI